ncbi:MAG: translocation/assembly module TamB domain-containing protein, partial [Planctomycetota bacterium]
TLLVNKSEITGGGVSQIKNLRIATKDGTTAQEPGADIKFAFAVDRKTNVLTINSIEANASLGQININQAVLPIGGNTQVPVSMDISAKNVDLEKVKPFAVLFASLPKETQLAGITESKVSISSDKNIYKVTTDSTKIKGLKLTYPGEEPFEPNEVSLVFEAEINPKQKTINVKTLQLESPQIKIRKGEFNKLSNAGKTKLTGQAELEYDWSAVSAFTAPFLPEGLTLKGKRKDSVSFLHEYPSEEPDKLMANLTADAKLGFGQAGYMGLDFGPTDVDIQIRDGLLKIVPFETTVNEGLFNFAGQVDFNQKPAQLKMAEPLQLMKNIKINDQTTKKLLMYLNPIFADAVNASGIASFSCEQLTIPLDAAAKNQAEVVGTISMDQLRLQSSGLLSTIFSAGGTGARDAVITVHPTKFVLRDGFLRYDDMQMDIGDNPVNFKGIIGLDKSLDMTVTLPYTADGRTVRVGQETTSRRIKVPLRGTVDTPELDVGKLLEGQLIQQLEEQLPNILDRLLK